MEPKEIRIRLEQGEDSLTEFKGVARNGFKVDPYDLAKAIVALANSGGGDVFLGVEKDGSPSGVGTPVDADALMRQASQVCRDQIHPAIWCQMIKIATEGVTLLVLRVPAFSPNRPFRAGHIYYIRDGNISREASREELIRLLQSADYHFDEQPVSDSRIDDLDSKHVEEILKKHYEFTLPLAASHIERYLKALKCLDVSGTPTVTGILFFGNEPSHWLPDAKISAVRFQGTSLSGEFLDRSEIIGRLPEQIESAIAFLERHILQPSSISGWERRESGIPLEALREALMNAVAHRDYRAAAQTRLFIFDDRVEIHNPGELLNRLTIESIRFGISQRRNPAIASLLALLARRENIGLGIPEMIRLMTERCLPEPTFEVGDGHFRAILKTAPGPAT